MSGSQGADPAQDLSDEFVIGGVVTAVGVGQEVFCSTLAAASALSNGRSGTENY